MPAYPVMSLGAHFGHELAPRASNATADALQVICAWPVSGQYGPGSRVLYYVLVAACVLARKSLWLRNACLAAALLFPVVAALHGIVLAAVHTDDAVDMDIYGAFQLCAIGVLVAPVTAKLSRTYFKNPGRNAIIFWSVIVVAGLISLTAEFYRVANATHDCTPEGDTHPLNSSSPFPYGKTECGLRCDPDKTQSPLRGGSGDNIYVVPAPSALTFNAGILLSAACCIPAILLVASYMLQSFKTTWNKRFEHQIALRLRAFVFVVETGQQAPTPKAMEKYVGQLTNFGIIRTSARQHRPRVPSVQSTALSSTEYVEDLNTGDVIVDGIMDDDSFAIMFDELLSRSTLTRHDYEIRGSSVQVLEVNLPDDIADSEIAMELRLALRDLDQEGVQAIALEALPPDISPEANWVMHKLREDQKDRTKRTAQAGANRTGRLFGEYAMVFIFGALVLAILIIGEINFWSMPVNYQTEPIANIGQWAPIAGTFLVVAGSIYVLISEEKQKERRRQRRPRADDGESDGYFQHLTRRFIQKLIVLGDMLSPQQKRFDDSDFKHNAQRKYPTVPGEEIRSRDLAETRSIYSRRRDSTSSLRTTTSDRHSPRDSREVSRERRGTDVTAGAATIRRNTLNLELPEVSQQPRPPRRATHASPGSHSTPRSSQGTVPVIRISTTPDRPATPMVSPSEKSGT